jgi:hypothetical protein
MRDCPEPAILNMMQNQALKYLHLAPDAPLPELAGTDRFKAVLAIEADVSQTWQWDACRWLVASGCRCLLTWGMECSAWEEAVEEANLERFDYGDLPAEEAVITTSHEEEELEEVFWFAKHRARHPALDLRETVLIHVSEAEARHKFEQAFTEA